jgi:hypothetical protein
MTKRVHFTATAGSALALALMLVSTAPANAQGVSARSVTKPDSAADLARPAAVMSNADREDMLLRLQQKREEAADRAQSSLRAPDLSAPQAAPGDPTGVASDALSEAPGTLRIGRNIKNTRAELAANSTLAEPAAVNNRNRVLYAGNFSHIERSSDHGVTYTAMAYSAGPADAPSVCCDNDMVMDDATKIVFNSTLYVNGALTNGVVRIFVRRASDFNTLCSYTIDPAGTANNILPDYPHIRLSRNFVYLSINALPTSGTGFRRMYRFNMADMKACRSAATRTFTQSSTIDGQRIWVPAEGAYNQTVMKWIHHKSANVIRVFTWPESSLSPTSVERTIQSSNFSNPDCRGGTGNFDFIERSTAWSIAGFRHRCTIARGVNQSAGILACYWNSAATGGITQAHVRSAIMRLSDNAVIAQPHVYNSSFCFGYPAVTGNILGDIGLSIAYGGRSGGGGTAVRAGVGISDNFSTGVGRFGSVTTTATGVANRSDGRYGDYFTIHPYQTCDRWFGATNFAWDSAPVDNANDVNTRWIEFGREAHLSCYNAAQ